MKLFENILSLTPLEYILRTARGETWNTIRPRNTNPVDQRDYWLPTPEPYSERPKESPPPKMLPQGYVDIIDKNDKNSPRQHPSSTSSIPEEYFQRWCGTTYNDLTMTGSTGNWVAMTETKLDEKPLKHFLMKKFKWIEDVTEVSSQRGGVTEIHLTVSPIHHSELMIPSVEKVVREKLYDELVPLITCMYEDAGKHKPRVIFSPSHSETILEHFK